MAICFVFFFIFASLVASIFSARILSVFPTPSKSHWILAQPLMKALVKAGHEVTVISPFPLERPLVNYTDIELTGLTEFFEDNMEHMFDCANDNMVDKYVSLFKFANYLTNFTLQHQNVLRLMNQTDEHFDLLFLEIFLDDALLGFAHHFNCPVIAMSTMGVTKWINDLVGSPQLLSHAPHLFLPFTDDMTFYQRSINTIFLVMEKFMMDFLYFPQQTQMYEAAFKNPKPSLQALRKTSVAVGLLNTHFSVSFPRTYLPNMIEVAGMQIKTEPTPLPSDIKQFIENSPHGVIYFSMGSNLRPSKMSIEKRNAIIEVFSKQNVRILWKYDDESLAVDKEKVMIKKWFPQDDVLAHWNVRLFISHGGLLSCTESLYHGVPLIGIPVFGDQQTNMDRAVNSGWGLRLDFGNLTASSLEWAINEMLTNDKYNARVKILSHRFRDQPQTALQTAQYWVEYVLRNDGADYIKSASQNLTFLQYYNLDVVLTFLFTITVIIFIIFVIIKRFVRQMVELKCRKQKIS